jgi:hypothetical protein
MKNDSNHFGNNAKKQGMNAQIGSPTTSALPYTEISSQVN